MDGSETEITRNLTSFIAPAEPAGRFHSFVIADPQIDATRVECIEGKVDNTHDQAALLIQQGGRDLGPIARVLGLRVPWAAWLFD
jgi:hypothetical protein